MKEEKISKFRQSSTNSVRTWPLSISTDEGTKSTQPVLRIGKWSTDMPWPKPTSGEGVFILKDRILADNGYKTYPHGNFEFIKGETKEKKELYGAMQRKRHTHYAAILGPKFNQRFHKFQRAVFFNPFHKRVTRLFGAGLRSFGGNTNARQHTMSVEAYRWIWQNKDELNGLSEDEPNIVPLLMILAVDQKTLWRWTGPEIKEVLQANSARRNEDIARMVYRYQRQRMQWAYGGDTLDAEGKGTPYLHFVMSLPSSLLRRSATVGGCPDSGLMRIVINNQEYGLLKEAQLLRTFKNVPF